MAESTELPETDLNDWIIESAGAFADDEFIQAETKRASSIAGTTQYEVDRRLRHALPLEGPGHARAMVENCVGAEPALILLFEAQRLKMVVERLRDLEAEVATPEQLLAYGEHVNRRFAEAIAEIALDAELTASKPREPSPSGNRKARRAAKANGRKLH